MKDKPQKSGFYWAKNRGCANYNLIVEVYGIAPFYRMRAWDTIDNTLIPDLGLLTVNEFGPKINETEE